MNLSLYGLAGVGVIDVGGEATPAFNLGLGQKFYVSKNWGFRFDLGLMAYSGANYFVANGGGRSPLADDTTTTTDDITAEVPISSFEREMNYDLHLSLAVIFLL